MNVGNVEKYRVSGGWRYRVRWSLPNGERRSKTFRLRKDADAWLRQVEADKLRGIVTDPSAGKVRLADYAKTWLLIRSAKLAPRTIELYQSQLRRHLLPAFGTRPLSSITVEDVRSWHAGLVRTVSQSTAAKCYRLLSTILSTAEEDGLIARTPCRVRGASVERAADRPLLTPEQVLDLADAIVPRYRSLVLLAAFGGLRRGELLGLRVRHLDQLHCTVRVEGQAQRITGQGRVVRETKSAAGVRTVMLPRAVLGELVDALADRAGGDPDAWLFVEENGSPVREASLYAEWQLAVQRAGLDSIAPHFHDLRHFAGTSAAQAGATMKELQTRLGHASPRAAMLYQHAAAERDRELADRIGQDFERLSARRRSTSPTLISGDRTHEEPMGLRAV